jgi:serine/threonine-protein kinase
LLALSPDGSRIVLTVRGPDGHRRLATRKLDQGQLALVPDTEEAGAPFFSPDGEWVGFFARGKMRKVNVNGGSPVTLTDAFTGATGPLGLFPSAGWGDDGSIVATLTPASGLVRVPAAGGAVEPLAASKTIEGEIPRWPQVLPGSRAVLFTAAGRNYENGNIDVILLKTGERKTIHHGGFRARYVGSGHLLFIHKNSLLAAPFDLRRLSIVGSPHPVIEDIAERLGLGWHFDVSTTGSFAYVSSRGEPPLSIFSLGRDGDIKALDSTPGLYGTPRFSRDGKYLAFSLKNSEGQQIWVDDLARGTRSRLTSLPGVNNSPVWTRDSQYILFRSVEQSNPGIYAVRADRSTEAKRVLELRNEEYPTAISPDGNTLAIWDFNAGGAIVTVPVDAQRDRLELGKPELFSHVAFNRSSPSRSVPAFSPDGRWLAYGSNESGKIEIYVTRFPGPGPKRRVSPHGGVYPVWSPNGRELLYKHEPSDKIMVVRYSSKGEDFASGEPGVWSESAVLGGLGEKAAFDIAPDGKHIAALMYLDRTSQPRPITHVTFLFNFFDELRRGATQNWK